MTQKTKMHLHHMPSFVKFIVLFQLFTDLIIILDMGIVRQIVGFIYLIFIPGIIVVKMLNWDKEDFSTIILFSVGLSIALLMIIGFAINELIPLFGISRPLSIIPLLVVMNLVVLLPCFLGYLRHAKISISNRVIPRNALRARALFVCLPVLSILGAFLVNVSGNTSLLLLMIVIISALTVLVVIHERFLPSNFLPFALFAIAVALLLHTSLITNYIVGWDVHSEYHVFKMTENAARWNVGFKSWDTRIAKGNAMLSVTVLPTIFSEVLNLDGTWIFKVIYPLIIAFMPLALFRMYSTQHTKKAAFLSVFFLMSSPTFYASDNFVTKQMIAQLFFVLLFLVILKERAGTFKREFLFTVFGFALVVSHYSTSYIFLFSVIFLWLFHTVFRRLQKITWVTLSEILLFFTMVFSWYIYTSAAAPFDAILDTSNHIFSTLVVDFFNPAARTTTVMRGLGAAPAVSVGHQIGRIFFYITEFFIVVGFIKLVFKRRNTTFSPPYILLSSFSMAILGMAVVLPNLAGSFRMERFYQISLIFLAVICVLGSETVFEFLLKRRDDAMTLILILLVLIPNFLFQTGFVYAITGDFTYSVPFGMSITNGTGRLIIYEQEVRGTEWMSTYTHSPTVYADYFSAFHVLTSYGLLSAENISLLSKNTVLAGEHPGESHTYLRKENVEKARIGAFQVMNASDVSWWLGNQNLIYSNGGCQIFKGTEISKNSTQE